MKQDNGNHAATPGPWFARNTHINGMEGQRNIDTADGRQICWTTRGWQVKEALANARLIASAPTLLEALEALVEDLLENQGIDAEAIAKHAARAAIAKARKEG